MTGKKRDKRSKLASLMCMHFTTKPFAHTLLLLAALSIPAACTIQEADPNKTQNACGGNSETAVTVTITGLPDGVPASVVLSVGDTKKTLTASGAVSLPAGEVTVATETVAGTEPIVRKAYKATSTSEKSCSGTNATLKVSVNYTLIPSSNKLWAANQQKDETLLGFASSALGASGAPAATVATKVAGGARAFDKDGNLWVSNGTAVERVPAGALAASGTGASDVVITSAAFEGGVPAVDAMAFDRAGNLWVVVKFASKIVRIDAADLAQSGARTPAVVLSGYKGPSAIAFDGDGNLFVVGDSGLAKFDAAQLGASSAAAPDAVITTQTPSPTVTTLAGATGLAFDANKNLWVVYGSVLARLEPADLADGSRTITPAVQVTTDVLALPEQLAFDDAGSVWFAYSAGKIAAYTKDQLGSSGTKVPNVVLSSANTGYATDLMFFPAAEGLPLYASYPASN